MLHDNILSTIGKTPIIKLNNIMEFFNCLNIDIYIKNESLNPGDSHKVRIALNMIEDAEKKGILKPNTGQTILEATGGNTGTGIAMAAAIKGYKVTLVIPDNYSSQKQKLLKALGAKIILADSTTGCNSHGKLAMEIQFENLDYVMLNQIENPANPDIHRLTTAPEILEDFQNDRIDYFVSCVGTGGHITGIGEILKIHNPKIKVIGVQPYGCDLLNNKFIAHKIQGVAVGLLPKVLNVNIIDKMIDVTFEESLSMMKLLIQKEALLVGLSSGASLAATLKLVKELKAINNTTKKINILTMAYDSARDYLNLLD